MATPLHVNVSDILVYNATVIDTVNTTCPGSVTVSTNMNSTVVLLNSSTACSYWGIVTMDPSPYGANPFNAVAFYQSPFSFADSAPVNVTIDAGMSHIALWLVLIVSCSNFLHCNFNTAGSFYGRHS